MRVLYDSHIFSVQTFGGISHYFVKLMNNLPEPWDYRLTVRASENEYLSLLRRPQPHLPLRRFPDHKKLYERINGLFDRRALRRGGYDVFHPTGFIPYFRGLTKAPTVVTVHDMIYLHNLRRGLLKKEIAEGVEATILAADRIIAISESTRRDLLEHFSCIDPGKVTVVYHGVTLPFTGNKVKLSGMPEQYVLFVGQRGDYKNFSTFLKAFAILAPRYPELKFVCTGRNFNHQEREEIARLGLAGRGVWKFMKAEEMDSLYAGAQCFVFPSRMEGFGMPVLEAFASDCPVVVSRASCLPEVAGDGGIYFDPDDAGEMAEKIELTLTDSEFRRRMIAAGRERLTHFSWESTAAATAAVYASALG